MRFNCVCLAILQVTDRTVVCSAHFKEDCFYRSIAGRTYLLPNSVPTEFQWTKKHRPRRLLVRAPHGGPSTQTDSGATSTTEALTQSDSEATLTAESEAEDTHRLLMKYLTTCNADQIMYIVTASRLGLSRGGRKILLPTSLFPFPLLFFLLPSPVRTPLEVGHLKSGHEVWGSAVSSLSRLGHTPALFKFGSF